MDLSSHKEGAGASLLFLPPCSPDFSAIDAFAKLKALLHKAAERIVNGVGRDRRPHKERQARAIRVYGPDAAGRLEAPIEMAIFHELAMTGQWDRRCLLDLIDAQAFASVFTTPDKIYTPQRYTPKMLAAIGRAYPRVQMRGPYAVRYPETP